jgi:hypothetical protein
MTRGFGGRLHPRHVRTIHIPAKVKTEAITTKGINTTPSQLGRNKDPSDHQPKRQRGTKLWRKIQLITKKVVLLVLWRG